MDDSRHEWIVGQTRAPNGAGIHFTRPRALQACCLVITIEVRIGHPQHPLWFFLALPAHQLSQASTEAWTHLSSPIPLPPDGRWFLNGRPLLPGHAFSLKAGDQMDFCWPLPQDPIEKRRQIVERQRKKKRRGGPILPDTAVCQARL